MLKKYLKVVITLFILATFLSACDSSIEPSVNENIPTHQVTIKIDFHSNFIFDKYDVTLTVDGKQDLITLKHGKDAEVTVDLTEGIHSLSFHKKDNTSINGDDTLDVSSDVVVGYDISCKGDKVDVKRQYANYAKKEVKNKVEVDFTNTDFYAVNYTEVCYRLMKFGFTNIEEVIKYDIKDGNHKRGDVESVTIDGKKDYKKGDSFNSDAKVVVTYHLLIEDDPSKKKEETSQKQTESTPTPEPTIVPTPTPTPETPKQSKSLFYTTNDKKTAKDGNSGKYAYSKLSSEYEIFYIIAFDEGYVYRFLHGNGDETCDRLAITGGTLNDVIVLTYHDGGIEWQNALCFKYKRQPGTLILQDSDYSTYTFDPTDLDRALGLLATKTIIDY